MPTPISEALDTCLPLFALYTLTTPSHPYRWPAHPHQLLLVHLSSLFSFLGFTLQEHQLVLWHQGPQFIWTRGTFEILWSDFSLELPREEVSCLLWAQQVCLTPDLLFVVQCFFHQNRPQEVISLYFNWDDVINRDRDAVEMRNHVCRRVLIHCLCHAISTIL